MERAKRPHSVERKISEIKETDTFVRVLGTAIDVSDGHFTLDDGESQIHVITVAEEASRIRDGQRVRVIGRIFKEDEPVLQGEIVQDMDKLDLELYWKVREILA